MAREKESTLALTRGLYLLRYVESFSAVAPIAFVKPEAVSAGDVAIISEPGEAEGFLAGPGANAVLVATNSVVLTLTVRAVEGGGCDAVIRLEPLSRPVFGGARVAPLEEETRAPASLGAPKPEMNAQTPMQFSILAHVSRHGDLVVAAGEWIGGPASPAQIEGFQLQAQGVKAAEIEYQALVAGQASDWTPWVKSGSFVGTRRKAMPLVGLRIRLPVELAQDFTLKGEAIFLGSTIASGKGTVLEFVSPSGFDPLIGLNFSVVSLSAATVAVGAGMAPAATVEASKSEPPRAFTDQRVRVFRAAPRIPKLSALN